MEGKFIRSLHANRVEICAVLFFGASLIAAIFLLVYFIRAPFRSPFIVEKKDGAFIIVDRRNMHTSSLPSAYTVQPDKQTLDFFTDTSECRITVERITKSKDETIEQWIHGSRDQLDTLTVTDSRMERLADDGTRVLYTITTEETGMSKIYYEERSAYLFAMRVFGESEACYRDFDIAIKQQ